MVAKGYRKVGKRAGLARHHIVPDQHAEYEAGKEVAVQVAGAIMCGMVEQPEAPLYLSAWLRDNGVVHAKQHGQGAERVRYDAEGNFCRHGHEAGIVYLGVGA